MFNKSLEKYKAKEKRATVLNLLINMFKVTTFKYLQSFGEVSIPLRFRWKYEFLKVLWNIIAVKKKKKFSLLTY